MSFRAVVISLSLVIMLAFSAGAEISFPSYSGFVNDYAGALSSGERSRIEALCRDLEAKTSAELAVVVVKTVQPLDPKMYAVKLFEKWGIGKKGVDNGILLLLAMEERRVEIEVGYGLEGVITDSKAGRILDDYVVPYFKKGQFNKGLYNGAAAISKEIITSKGASPDEKFAPEKRSSNLDTLFLILSINAALYGVVFIFLGLSFGGIAAFFLLTLGGACAGFLFGGLITDSYRITFMIVFAIIGGVIGWILYKIGYKGFGGPGGGGGGRWTGSSSSWSGGGGSSFGGFGGGRSGGGGAGRSF